MSEPFASMTPAEAERFMAVSNHPIRDRIAEKVGGAPVTDLGCGRGIRIKELYASGQYFGIDCSAALVDIARRDNPGYEFAVADIGEYLSALAPKSLTNAIAIAVFEHAPSLEEALRLYEAARRAARTFYVGWHTPPHFSKTEILQVQAELDRPIWQNRYQTGNFHGAVDVQRTPGFELWTVRD